MTGILKYRTFSIRFQRRQAFELLLCACVQVAARRILYSTFMWPAPESIELGLWTQVLDFSRCRRIKQSGPKPPGEKKMGKKEIAQRAFAFALMRAYLPRGVECSVTSEEPSCQLLHNYMAVNRTVFELGRALGTPRAGLMVENFTMEVQQQKQRITSEELWNTQLTTEMTGAESFHVGELECV